MRRTRSGLPIRSTRPTATRPRTCVRPVMPASSATHRPGRCRTSSCPTWWPRRSAARARRRKLPRRPRSAPSATTRSDMERRAGRPQAPANGSLASSAGLAPAAQPGAQPVRPPRPWRSQPRRQSWLERLQNSRNGLGLAFMLPAASLLLLFLSYPLGLGVWLGFTDAKIGRGGMFVGLENYEFLFGDSVARLALFNTIFYTTLASILKFLLGLWLALLLNRSLRLTTFLRAVVLLPWIVPTALSAIAFWWIFDSQFSIISWVLTEARHHRPLHRLPGRALERALLDHRSQRLARHSLRRHFAAGRAADHLPGTLRGGCHRRRHAVAALLAHHAAAAHADHRGGDDLLGAVHLHRLPAHLRADPRRAAQRDPPDGDACRSSGPSRAARSAKARRSPSRWCRSCSRPSCSPISGCSAAPGSKEAIDERKQGRQRRDGLPGHPHEPLGDHLPADRDVPVRAAVSLLLDGDHGVQAERASCCRARAIRSG